jgi:hypothetical protein
MYNTPKHSLSPSEGFMSGIVAGTGYPDCLRESAEATQLLELVNTKGKEDGNGNGKEFQLILSKLICFKKDLLSPSVVVNATRFQPFETSHDRVAVAELTGMCLMQTVTPRDLDISFASWRDRGKILLRNLCTEAQLSENDVVRAETLFKKIIDDVYDISVGRCIKTDFGNNTSKGDVGSYEPDSIKSLRPYTHTFDGLSGSGWN